MQNMKNAGSNRSFSTYSNENTCFSMSNSKDDSNSNLGSTLGNIIMHENSQKVGSMETVTDMSVIESSVIEKVIEESVEVYVSDNDRWFLMDSNEVFEEVTPSMNAASTENRVKNINDSDGCGIGKISDKIQYIGKMGK